MKKPYRDRCEQECLAKPIFLFQSNRICVWDIPEGYEYDDGFAYWIGEGEPKYGRELSNVELSKMENVDGKPYAMDNWNTEKVFLTREDGENYGRAKHYRFPEGWRVYSVPCDNELWKIIVDSEN